MKQEAGKAKTKPRGPGKAPAAAHAGASVKRAPATTTRAAGQHREKQRGAPKSKATTLRLRPSLYAGLALLQGVLKRPMNAMVNEAVDDYIGKRTAEVEANLTGLLASIKAYRQADPEFKLARARFVEAESRHGRSDPAQGVVDDTPEDADDTPEYEAKKSSPREGSARSAVRLHLRR